MTDSKRRSDRIVLTVPLRIFGADATGREFEKDGRTLTINRHGARIQFHHALNSGQIIRILNLASKQESTFRVIGPVAPYTESGGEWGIENGDPKGNIWGIQFPPMEEEERLEFKALLECKKCRTRAMFPVSLVEVEVLDTAGVIVKPCGRCLGESSWGYAEINLTSRSRSESKSPTNGNGQDTQTPHAKPAVLPCNSAPVTALIRDYCGFSEIVRSENVSSTGFSFTSGKDYAAGQGILATCPYDSRSATVESHARIVQRQEGPEVHRKVYVVRYEPGSEESGSASEFTR